MKIDLSKLDAKLSSKAAENSCEGDSLSEAQNPPQGDYGALEGNPYKGLEKEQQLHRQMAQAYKEYQKNIMASAQLRAAILKGAAQGQSAEELLLLAAECISAMTGDPAFCQAVRRRVEGV